MSFRPLWRAPRTVALVTLLAAAGVVSAQAPAPTTAPAAERESLEALRQTTLALIEALVQSGALTRERADALMADAKKRAEAALAQAPAEPPPKPAAPPEVRVPYVPQVVRDQIRNELKDEIVARARTERWGVPNATAEWTDRIQIEGDVRVRGQADRADSGNLLPEQFLIAAAGRNQTRAPDFAASTADGLATGSTQDDRDRYRVRARLAITAKVADSVSAGLRLTTGSATDRVGTNQTLGQNFNKASFTLDRAYVRWEPVNFVTLTAGRIANPFFSTDLVWSENLSFEGGAATFRLPPRPGRELEPFVTLGYFPSREESPPRKQRTVMGAQAGLQWEASEMLRVRAGIAQYAMRGFAGRQDPDYTLQGPGRSYGQYEYEAGLRQRGNSLFLTNNPLEYVPNGLPKDRLRWGLASAFKPLAITAAAEFSAFSPVIVQLSGEYVRNTAFDRGEILSRTGVNLTDGSPTGYQLRSTIGAQSLRNRGDWQLQLGWRRLGSDAVVDAFTDGDFGLGGTNLSGYVVGFSYGIDRNSQLGLRYLSAQSIDSPTVRPQAKDRFAVDIYQLDFNVRF
jgi:hypothetical protein